MLLTSIWEGAQFSSSCLHPVPHLFIPIFISITCLEGSFLQNVFSPLNLPLILVYVVPSNQLVEALRYKPEGCGFDSWWFHWNFSLNTSGHTVSLGLTQPLTDMSTRNISWGLKVAIVQSWQPSTFMFWLPWNLEASLSWQPQALSRPVQGLLYQWHKKWQTFIKFISECYMYQSYDHHAMKYVI
jgi:hypothetical protein